MRIKITTLLALLLTFSVAAWADGDKDQFNPVSTAVNSLKIGADARAGGMGDVGVATDPDVNSQAWNVAKYPFCISRAGLAVNYTPWLRKIVNDIDLGYMAGYMRLGDYTALSSSLRYFSLGEVDAGDNLTVKPYELAFDVGVSRMLSENLSAGIALRYIYSDLSGHYSDDVKPGNAFAADIGLYWNKYVIMGSRECQLALGMNISNVGSKVKYGDENSYFLPTNLRIGASYLVPINEYNKFSISLDLNKLLVPTMPRQKDDESDEAYQERLQKDYYDMSPITGIFKSFGDAPDGFSEELKEIQWSIGAEYIYNDKFILRAGYHD